jgi:hypothetical protein
MPYKRKYATPEETTKARRLAATRHGLSHTKIHNIWLSMKQRCDDMNCTCYARYGGRGIKVCERWYVFENFLADMGQPPPGMQIERIDNNAGYSPENCKWATLVEQANNKRNNAFVTANGVTLTLMQWQRRSGIHWATIKTRIENGWPPTAAVTLPPDNKRRYRAWTKIETPAKHR